MEIDISITVPTILTVNNDEDVVRDGCILIDASRIIYVGPALDAPNHTARRSIDASHHIALPGFINLHTHAPMVLFRGLADDLPLKQWLEEHIWPREAAFVDGDFVETAGRLAVLEMLLSGTTSFVDMYFAEDRLARVCIDAGIRGFLGEGILDLPTPVSQTVDENLERAARFASLVRGERLVRPIIAPHAPYTTSPETLRRARALADDEQTLLHIHLAEEEWELASFKDETGMTPTAYLANVGAFDGKTLVAHANWLEPEDIGVLASHDVGVAHNPQSNMKLATGICPVPDLIEAGVAVGLGTDGASSNNDLDMIDELRTAALLHKAIRRDPTAIRAFDAVAMATSYAARALGLDGELGVIAVGARADVILLDVDAAHLTPMYDPYSHITYAARASDVTHVIIDGFVVVDDGVCLTVDRDATLEDARAYARRIAAWRPD